MTAHDGHTEATARPCCRCGHYAREHEPNGDRPNGPCYLCECPGISASKQAKSEAKR